MNLDIGAIVIIISALCGVAGIASFLNNRKKDSGTDGEWRGELRAELKNINTRLENLESKIDKNADKTDSSIRRLHKRMDDHLRHEHNMKLPKESDSDE